MTNPLYLRVDELHNEFQEQVTEVISACQDSGSALRLNESEIAGVVMAVLTHALTALVVQTGVPEHQLLIWCHDYYQKLAEAEQH